MDKLQKIAIVLPKSELVLSSIVGSYKLFLDAIRDSGSEASIMILGHSTPHPFFDEVFQLHTHGNFTDQTDLDLIIVPAIKSDIDQAMSENQGLIKWLYDQYQKGAHLASLCSGAFLLASSGLLDKKYCTCHWAQAEYFQQCFPKTYFRKNEIITECDRIFTSGGAFSFLNLIIYLIERFYGSEMARKLYSIYEIDYSRKSQAPFVIFETKKDHPDQDILKAQQFIETQYSNKITIADIATHVNMGERTLARRFKKHTAYTINQYLQRIRIEVAKSLLAETNKTIAEIQYEVGYNDPKTFRTIFRKQTNIAPLEYRRQYQLTA